MHVGVFPLLLHVLLLLLRLPHARGGVSAANGFHASLRGSSPCTWGCFHGPVISDTSAKVFPMHVGVFPWRKIPDGVTSSLPHARGGVSSWAGHSRRRKRSSPCTWGCFWRVSCFRSALSVFPMHVGVFPVLV